jgi:hypothetical protein
VVPRFDLAMHYAQSAPSFHAVARDRVVRHGHGPQRAIQTGVGPVEVRRAKVRDRADVETDQKIRFASAILPKWARRTKSLDAVTTTGAGKHRLDGLGAGLSSAHNLYRRFSSLAVTP